MALVVNMSVRLICVDSSFTQITFSRLRYSFSFVSISHTFCATRPSWFHGKYSPSTKPPQALNVQSQARMSPLSLMTNVDPQSRIHESLLVFQPCGCFRESGRAFWAGFEPFLQLSGRSGQSIHICVCPSNSAGILKPSCFGVIPSILFAMIIGLLF